jgi:uncharacterized membrane protein
MSEMPAHTLYHRLLGMHAPDLRRSATILVIGVIVTVALRAVTDWRMSLVLGWDAAALTFLLTTWSLIVRADGPLTQRLATREDTTRPVSDALLIAASVASLLGVGFALHVAGTQSGSQQILLIGLAVATVALSWLLANTVYTLRYAHLHFAAPAGIDIPEGADQPASYLDFAYVAFTIGMCYQVSDTTLRTPRIRRTALAHAMLSYIFGVAIVAGSVNLISGLLV